MRALLLLALLLSLPARAEMVTEIPDATTLVLATGQKLTPAGITAPPEQKTALEQLALHQDITFSKTTPDRFGRRIARLTLPGGRDLATELLRQGAAQIHLATLTDPALLTAEAEARAARRGLWAEENTRLLTTDEAARFTNQWRTLEGTPRSVATVHGTTYVNFGPDWKTDFTLRLNKRLAAKLHPEQWPGRKLLLRGWLQWRNGPEIELTDPRQVELPEKQANLTP